MAGRRRRWTPRRLRRGAEAGGRGRDGYFRSSASRGMMRRTVPACGHRAGVGGRWTAVNRVLGQRYSGDSAARGGADRRARCEPAVVAGRSAHRINTDSGLSRVDIDVDVLAGAVAGDAGCGEYNRMRPVAGAEWARVSGLGRPIQRINNRSNSRGGAAGGGRDFDRRDEPAAVSGDTG